MRVQLAATAVGLLLTTAGCARNSQSNDTGAATRDTSITASPSDSAEANQTESGVVDSSGQSTLGPGAEQTRPDQGQPVTSKGDTVNVGVDSAPVSSGVDSSQSYDANAAGRDTMDAAGSDSIEANQTESGVTDSSGQSTLGPEAEQTRPDQGQPVTSKGDTINTGIDSSSTPQ